MTSEYGQCKKRERRQTSFADLVKIRALSPNHHYYCTHHVLHDFAAMNIIDMKDEKDHCHSGHKRRHENSSTVDAPSAKALHPSNYKSVAQEHITSKPCARAPIHLTECAITKRPPAEAATERVEARRCISAVPRDRIQHRFGTPGCVHPSQQDAALLLLLLSTLLFHGGDHHQASKQAPWVIQAEKGRALSLSHTLFPNKSAGHHAPFHP